MIDWAICSQAPASAPLRCQQPKGSSQALTRAPTWLEKEATTTAPPTDISRPMTIQLVRSVATYSMITNMPKNSSEEPRSFSKIRISRLIAQITRIGPRSRPRGR